MIHPLSAIKIAWSAFWDRTSEGVRADRDGMKLEIYNQDIERFRAFADLKRTKPIVVKALEERSGKIIYDMLILNPQKSDFVNQLIHLHGQATILIKDVLTEILNAEAYLKITQKELEKIEEERKRRTVPMTPRQ